MIKSIKNYFDELFQGDSVSNTAAHAIELATAVLMIEISLADDHISDDERQIIKTLLLENFNLEKEEINELINLAEDEVNYSVSLYEFTRLLNAKLDADDKVKIIEGLWRVAYADSVLDKYEEYYIRKVADLLYVPHTDYIKAKLRADNLNTRDA